MVKQALIPFSFLSALSLIADEIPHLSYHPKPQSQIYSESTQCSEEPECPVPDSIQYRGGRCFYPPQDYNLECACGLSFSGDLLYWYGRETDLLYAIKFRVVSPLAGSDDTPVALPSKYQYLEAKWALGFKAAIGANFNCDGWDAALRWTYYQNNQAKTTANAPFTGGAPALGESALLGLYFYENYREDPFFTKAKARWKCSFNQIDLELGRTYWLSPSFRLRPFTGLRVACSETLFKVRYLIGPYTQSISQLLVMESNLNKLKNTYWGAGFLAGIAPCFSICQGFAIFGNLDGALLWGKFEETDRINYLGTSVTGGETTIDFSTTNKATGSYYRMQGVLDLGIGLRFWKNWCSDRFRSTLDIGWEHHMWINHSLRHRPLGSATSTFGSSNFTYFTNATAVKSDLVFGGLTVRAKFDF